LKYILEAILEANEKLKNEIVSIAEETGIPCRILERDVFYMNAYYCPESLKTLWKDIDLLAFEKDILGSYRDNFSDSLNKEGWQSSNVC
jgi:purine-nucleoside phosphorylase